MSLVFWNVSWKDVINTRKKRRLTYKLCNKKFYERKLALEESYSHCRNIVITKYILQRTKLNEFSLTLSSHVDGFFFKWLEVMIEPKLGIRFWDALYVQYYGTCNFTLPYCWTIDMHPLNVLMEQGWSLYHMLKYLVLM